MSFYMNSIERRENRTFLICRSQKYDQSWTNAEIDLDEFIGNNDGQFDCSGSMSGFTQSAENITLERGPHGVSILGASLMSINGERRYSSASLSDWIQNIDGKLVFGKPRGLRNYEVISDDRTYLLCESQREDGSWVPAKIDLDAFIGNDDGKFDSTGTMSGFTQSAKKVHFRLEGIANDLRPVIKTSLRTIGGDWREASLDLLEVIKNDDGKLVPLKGNKHGP